MKQEDSIARNLKIGMYLATGSNFIAAVLFLIAYIITGNIWFIVAFAIVALAGTVFIFVVQHLKRKFANLIKKEEEYNKE